VAERDDPIALTGFVKEEALRLGFAFAGVTTPDPPPHLEVYRQWIADGRHGEMAYLARPSALERREDPRRILPECRSILVLAWPYRPPVESDNQARVAAYARGPDYHDVLVEKLRSLITSLEARLGGAFPFRLYTDTGPLLERELAQRAGLGWIGKNTCLISPRHGSYFLLAEALLGVQLVPDSPFAADRCGSCTRCLEACPTDCILPDRTLDARRCISYLTIELKGTIPAELRPSAGNWLFGCDICQEVCPWNVRFAGAPSGADIGEDDVTAEEILTADADTIRRLTQGTALRRAGRRGLLRNAAVVAGNTRAADRVPALVERLRADDDAIVRAHAAWALGRIGGPAAIGALEASLRIEADGAVRTEIEWALAESSTG
jgi:epoxyqueuosine reductase